MSNYTYNKKYLLLFYVTYKDLFCGKALTHNLYIHQLVI